MKQIAAIILLATAAFAADEKSAIASQANSKSLVVVDPKLRSADFVQAFELLRKDKPTLKVTIQTSSGMTLGNVTEILAAQNGTLLMIKYASSSGNKYHIIPVEEVKEIAYSPS